MTRLSDYLAWIDEVGGDKARWLEALKTTQECQREAIKETTPIARLRTFYKCRKGKKLPPRGA